MTTMAEVMRSVGFRKALVEVRSKSLRKIQTDTAEKWLDRACAYMAESRKHPGEAKFLEEATDCAHEAIEHAALTGDEHLSAKVIATIRSFGLKLWKDDGR